MGQGGSPAFMDHHPSPPALPVPPQPRKIGPHLYNFWQDAANPRGLWRRTTFESYRTDAPQWEVVLDVDALGQAEGVSWVWGGHTLLDEGVGIAPTRTMVSLSRGGADATEMREFDLQTKAFVDGGFFLPEAKGSVSWKSRDVLLVGTDFGAGSLTDSGYPRQVSPPPSRSSSHADAES